MRNCNLRENGWREPTMENMSPQSEDKKDNRNIRTKKWTSKGIRVLVTIFPIENIVRKDKSKIILGIKIEKKTPSITCLGNMGWTKWISINFDFIAFLYPIPADLRVNKAK